MKILMLPWLTILAPLLVAFSGISNAATSDAESPRLRENFDADWLFVKGDPKGADAVEFDHSQWRQLDLPHDWSIEGPFEEKNASKARGGYLPNGTGWYRKTFKLPANAAGKKVFIEFDGIYMNGEVWINGHRLGKRPYGYIGVEYDLTSHLKLDGDNILAVRVDDSLQPSSRWYSGCGIYRHVWMTVTDKLHVTHWGTQVSTPKITVENAEVAVKTTVKNAHSMAKTVTVTQNIVDANGKQVARVSKDIELAAGKEMVVDQSLKIATPALWSPKAPNLYSVRTELRDGKVLIDNYESPLGVRTVVFDAERGMLLNGESVIMKGVCNHHDLGPLGAAMWDQALERRLRMLKEMGCNAIRTAHNPPSPELLEICNRLGFLVINETFDEWRRGWAKEKGILVASKENKGKSKHGYNLHFDEWAQRDLIDHIRRDRNHPSVIMWSVGNEVPEAQKYGDIETLKILRDLSHKHDPTRLVTVGCNFVAGANKSGFTEHMDVVGYNGGGDSCFQYEADHAKYPKRLMYASEVPHTLQTRGEYRTLAKFRMKKHQPSHMNKKEVFPETNIWYESAYDNAAVRINARDSWRLTKNLPYFAGEFRWTGFDYIGESGGWPRVLGNFGIIDICNFPKDTYYFYQSQWTEKSMVHLLPHWTMPGKEGSVVPVWCYTNGDSVELFLNDKSLGVKKFTKEMDMHLEWMVPYAPGELKAVASKNGKVVATTSRRTAGPVAKFTIKADQTKLSLKKRDLSFITVDIVDKDGNFCPKGDRWVSFEVEGPGRVLATGNGDPISHESFQAASVKAFNGKALAIIAPTGEEGEIVVKAYWTSYRWGNPMAEIKVTVESGR
ncbi:MAG: beta-galactosidase [Crocinitomicaceae bacterium]|jgi:beta-galactosidase